MREIKFRFKLRDRKNKKIIYVYTDLYNPNYSSDILQYPIDLTEWEILNIDEYTGIKDKNDKKMYEGDIYKYTDNGGLFIIKYFEGKSGFKGYCTKYGEGYKVEIDSECEIVGNIHENPELAK